MFLILPVSRYDLRPNHDTFLDPEGGNGYVLMSTEMRLASIVERVG